MIVEEVIVHIDPALATSFPGLSLLAFSVEGLDLRRGDPRVNAIVNQVVSEVRGRYTLQGLKDVPIFKAYRNFYWRIGIDPTKMRPSSEALVRRVLAGRVFPRINPLVDLYNLASARTGVTMAAYDSERIQGRLSLSWARPGERFRGIGMEKEAILTGREVVLRDESSVLSIYPYRDSDHSKITIETVSAVVVACGVPGIDYPLLVAARDTFIGFLQMVYGS